ncbi:acyl carrier protein [Streptomyces olivaceoviridis]|uniref:acyl carrier protein n=1 Tax=Streptomyces olivaceoviridis TaxID=1921 RepID=UPI0036F8B76B
MSAAAPLNGETVRKELAEYLEDRVKATVAYDQDLFASGLVSSLFAMELVVHLERSYAVSIVGPDLQLDHFRTVDAMVALVQRLRGASAEVSGG